MKSFFPRRKETSGEAGEKIVGDVTQTGGELLAFTIHQRELILLAWKHHLSHILIWEVSSSGKIRRPRRETSKTHTPPEPG